MREQAEANRLLAEDNARSAEINRLAAKVSRDLAERQKKLAEINLATAETRFQKSRSAVQELTKLGQDLMREPHMEKPGRQVLEKAAKFQEWLLEDKSTDPAVHLETARAKRSLGWTQHELGQEIAAENSTLDAIRLLDTLLAVNPSDHGLRRELRNSQAQLAYVRLEIPRSADAIQAFHEAMRVGEALAAEPDSDPSDQAGLANVLTNWAEHLSLAGESDQAQAVLERSVGLLRPLVKSDPKAEWYQRELALALGDLATLVWRRDRRRGEQFAREALGIRRRLQSQQVGSRTQSEYTARSLQQVGERCAATGRDTEAESLFNEANNTLTRAISSYPQHVSMRHRLLENSEQLRKVLLKRDNNVGFDHSLQITLNYAKSLVADLPDSAADRLRLAKLLSTWARRQAASDKRQPAAQTYWDAIAHYQRLQQDSPGQTQHRAELIVLTNEFIKLGRAAAGEARIIAVMEERLRQLPNDPAAMNSLAWWLSVARDKTLRNPTRALELVRQAVVLTPVPKNE